MCDIFCYFLQKIHPEQGKIEKSSGKRRKKVTAQVLLNYWKLVMN
jgi:hypothetical protein